VQIASGSGTVSVGARLGGYSSGIPSQGYTAEIESNGTVNLWRVDNFTLLGSYTISGFSLNTWYTLGLRANGSSISVEVNGSTVIGPVTNTAFTSGNTGVWSYAPNGAGRHRFDNFSVTMLGGGFTGASKVLALRVYTKVERRILAAVTPPSTGLTYRVYYYAGGRPIAMRVLPPNDGVGTVHYLLSDHLGSMSASVDPNLNVTRQYFYPYGGVRSGSGTLPTAKGFTGQYADSSTGLMFFNARYYSSYLGRFISADTLVPKPSDAQAYNRYSYVHNNPLKHIDPTGHQCGKGPFAHEDCGTPTPRPNRTPTRTPTRSSTTTATPAPSATQTPTSGVVSTKFTIQDVIDKLETTTVGAEIMRLVMASGGFKVIFRSNSGGSNLYEDEIEIPDPNGTFSNGQPIGVDVAAEILAHELIHVLQHRNNTLGNYSTSLEAEREAYLVGYTVADELAGNQGHQQALYQLATSYSDAEKYILDNAWNNDKVVWSVYYFGARCSSACNWNSNLIGHGFSSSAIATIKTAAGVP
jgi:RHS repeat-associated protein